MGLWILGLVVLLVLTMPRAEAKSGTGSGESSDQPSQKPKRNVRLALVAENGEPVERDAHEPKTGAGRAVKAALVALVASITWMTGKLMWGRKGASATGTGWVLGKKARFGPGPEPTSQQRDELAKRRAERKSRGDRDGPKTLH